MDSYRVVDELSDEQVHQLVRLYQNEWWTAGRAYGDVKKMLNCSDVVVGVCRANEMELIAFARVLTDFIYKALLLDVIVKDPFRRSGLGRVLIDHVTTHQALQSVAHFELYCLPDLVPFYERWGFTRELSDLQLMRMVKVRA